MLRKKYWLECDVCIAQSPRRKSLAAALAAAQQNQWQVTEDTKSDDVAALCHRCAATGRGGVLEDKETP